MGNFVWSGDSSPAILPLASESCTPALVNFNGNIYMFCDGPGQGSGGFKGDATIWQLDPNNMTGTPTKIIPQGYNFNCNQGSPSLAVVKQASSETQLLCCAMAIFNAPFATPPFYPVICTSADGINWKPISPTPDFMIYSSMSLVVYQGSLYGFFIDKDRKISYAVIDPFNAIVGPATQIPSHYAHWGTTGKFGAPGLAIFNNVLYVVYEGDYPSGGSDGCLFCNTMSLADGIPVWTDAVQIGKDLITSGSAALVVSPDGTTLCALHETGSQGGTMYSLQTTDGSTWTNTQIAGVGTTGAPACIVVGNKYYCYHEGRGQAGNVLCFTGVYS